MNQAANDSQSTRHDRADESQVAHRARHESEINDSESSEGEHNVVTRDGSVDLKATVETDSQTGETDIEATGTVQVGDSGRSVNVTVRAEVNKEGETTVTLDTHGESLTPQESESVLRSVATAMVHDLNVSAGINRETFEGLQGVAEGAVPSIQSSANQSGGITISATFTPSLEGVSDQDQFEAETQFRRDQQQAREQFRAGGGDTKNYDGGSIGSPGSVDNGVINDAALNGLASNNDFQYRSQGNVAGNYFSKTADGVMAEVSTSDRRPGFWNGNRAEIAFNKRFKRGDTTGFRSFFDIHSGNNFSIFQLFNQLGKEGFPEAMLKVVDGKLILGGRAFSEDKAHKGEDIVLGVLPEGKFGINVTFEGDKVSVQLLNATGEPVGSGYTAVLSQPNGEFHYRAGPYFDGYNNKQFGSDMKNVTAKVEIIEPTMIG